MSDDASQDHTTHPPLVVAVDSSTGLTINFTEHYGRNFDDWELFPMERKRNFLNMAEKCAAVLQALVDDPDFAFGLLNLRFRLSLPDGDPDLVGEAELPGAVYELINEKAASVIRSICDAEYTAQNVNIDTDHVGSNEELQFTNQHARAILQWSMGCLAVAPLVTTMMSERDIRTTDSTAPLMDAFCAILPRFQPEGVDLLAKLRKLVESRVLQTRYSDKVMWNMLRNVAVDPFIFIDKLFRRFVVEGIPKLDQGTNIIKFFQAYLKNQIKYKFYDKFAIAYRPIRSDVMDGDGVSAMEQLETDLIRRDEGAAVVGEAAVNAAFREVWRELGWKPSEAEVEHWANALRKRGVGSWQRSVVTKFFLPRVGRVELIRTRTLPDFARMLLAVRAWCIIKDLPALAEYLGSYAAAEQVADGKRLIARKKFVHAFVTSAQYKELLGRHFGLASQAVVDSGVVIEMISSVHCGQFYRISEFGEEVESEPTEVDHRIEAVAQEILRFIAHAACPRE